MKSFKFTIEEKVTTWMIKSYVVRAEREEDAKNKILKLYKNDLYTDEDIELIEQDFDYVNFNLVPPELNNGFSTKLLFDEYENLIEENNNYNDKKST